MPSITTVSAASSRGRTCMTHSPWRGFSIRRFCSFRTTTLTSKPLANSPPAKLSVTVPLPVTCESVQLPRKMPPRLTCPSVDRRRLSLLQRPRPSCENSLCPTRKSASGCPRLDFLICLSADCQESRERNEIVPAVDRRSDAADDDCGL